MATIKKLMTLLNKEGLTNERSEIISKFTFGRTTSARGLTQTEVDQLCQFFEQNSKDVMDKKRKRVLASIFGAHEKMNKKITMEYAKGIACKAAKVSNFNEITGSRLDSIYNAFLKAQKDLDYSRRLVTAFILEQQCYN